MKIIYLLNQ